MDIKEISNEGLLEDLHFAQFDCDHEAVEEIAKEIRRRIDAGTWREE